MQLAINPSSLDEGKYDARKLSANQQALLRQMAVSRVVAGESVSGVTRAYGLGEKTLYKWLRTYREQGSSKLVQSARQGRKPQLSSRDLKALIILLARSEGEYWTRQKLLDWGQKHLALTCSVTTLGRALGAAGLVAPRFVGGMKANIAGEWHGLDELALQQLIKRKLAAKVSLCRVSLSLPALGFEWHGWAAFSVKGGLALYQQSSLLDVLRHVNAAGQAIVVSLAEPLPTTQAWQCAIAELHQVTIVSHEQCI